MIIKPPFSRKSALAKVQAAEDAWNSCDPEKVAQAYTRDCHWRNRDEIFQGRERIIDFLTRKWRHETHYSLMKELWCHSEERISVRFEYEWYNYASGEWFRTHGNEHWEFNRQGLMSRRDMSANDLAVHASSLRYADAGAVNSQNKKKESNLCLK